MDKSEENSSCDCPETPDPSCFHVVALGASAGGLESLEKFFKAMPPDSGLAFIVLQHLSPDFRSLMDELLGRHTDMVIRKAEDDMEVEPNTIYLNPPRMNMIISGGRLYLSDVEPSESLTLPIDQFFRSLAQDARRQAVGIVLSGTGSDGSRGIRDIYEAGGLVVTETEETAKFDGMPRSANETGCVHLVLPPEAMPEALVSYVNQALSPQDFAEQVFVPPRLGGMETVFRLLRDEYGIDFSLYKPNTVVRRIERRVSLHHSDSIDTYVEKLESDPEELSSLYRDLLIGVTQFFRDREAFEYLTKELLPEIVSSKQADDELRVWIAGAATGEEAYSIAILISEAMEQAAKHFDVKVFATDVHSSSLEFASAGVYPKDSVRNMEPLLLEKYFRNVPDGYQIGNCIRQMIVFAQHNVFKDAPFTKLDLVSCRNLLIYLQPLAQRKALSLFHFGLRTRGYLVLGPSESVGDLKEEFETCNNRWKIFRKRRDVRLPADMRLPLSSGLDAKVARPIAPPTPSTGSPPPRNLLMAYDRLLEFYVSAAFLIDENRNVIHVFGNATQYMQPKTGRLSTDVLEMVHPDLKPVLASAIQRVRRGSEPHVSTAVRYRDNNEEKAVKVHVIKLSDAAHTQSWFVITLEEQKMLAEKQEAETEASATSLSQDRVDDLETELRYTKESLQTTVEELETSNEELQATNEELVASNEELQSTNAELHSVNEELYTVNAEYQNKIVELTEMTADMENLLESTEIGTIFLDESLTIRKFTGRIAEWFDLVKADVGRRISAFSNNLNYKGLVEDIRQVLEEEIPRERELQDQAGAWLLLRLHPYRRDGQTQGVVMTLIDVTSLKQTRAKLQRLSAIVESSDDAIIGKTFDGIIESWNRAAETLFGFTAKEAIGQDISIILPESGVDEAHRYFEQIRSGDSVEPIEVQRRTKRGREVDIAVRFSPVRDINGEVRGISAICRDITFRKAAQRELAKLALVAKHTDNGVVITDANGLTEWVNEGFTRITGFTLEEARGQKPGDLLQGADTDQATVEHMREQLAAGEGFNVEILNYGKTGKPYWLAIEARPLKDEQGQLTGFMAIERDISALKQAQEAASEEVVRRDRFLAMLSHELRNPLNAIQNGLVLLEKQRNNGDGEHREVEQLVKSQVAQVARLLDDLLDLSRITQGKIALQKRPIDIRSIVQRAADAMNSFADSRNCRVELTACEGPATVNGDPARLQQVFVNLLNNAVKHSRPGQVVRVHVEKGDPAVQVTVRDEGDGINPHAKSKIFDMFFQDVNANATSEGGLGLGLSLVKDFVNRHGGDVSVDSDGIGKGSCFTVSLPLTDEQAQGESEKDSGPVQSLRIVVVEDQAPNRLILRKMLELDGHNVREAANGTQALEIIEAYRPDLAVIDIGLPDISGYEVAEKVRSRDAGHPITLAALTGYGQASDKERAAAAGFDAHLVKPLDASKLAEVLARVSERNAI